MEDGSITEGNTRWWSSKWTKREVWGEKWRMESRFQSRGSEGVVE